MDFGKLPTMIWAAPGPSGLLRSPAEAPRAGVGRALGGLRSPLRHELIKAAEAGEIDKVQTVIKAGKLDPEGPVISE